MLLLGWCLWFGFATGWCHGGECSWSSDWFWRCWWCGWHWHWCNWCQWCWCGCITVDLIEIQIRKTALTCLNIIITRYITIWNGNGRKPEVNRKLPSWPRMDWLVDELSKLWKSMLFYPFHWSIFKKCVKSKSNHLSAFWVADAPITWLVDSSTFKNFLNNIVLLII